MIVNRKLLFTPFIRKNSAKIIMSLIIGLLSSMTTVLLPVCIGKFYTLVFAYSSTRSSFMHVFPKWCYDTIPHFLAFYTVLIVLYFLLNYGRRYLVAQLGELLSKDLRERLFAHQLDINTKIYQVKGTGKYLLRYTGDLKSIQNFFTRGLITFVIDMFLVVMIIMTLAMIAKVLTVVFIAALLLMIVPIIWMNRNLHQVSTARRNQRSNLLSFVNQRLGSMTTIKGFNRFVPEQNKFNKRSQRIYELGLTFHKVSSFIAVLIPTMLYIMIGVMIYVIYYQKQNGTLLDQSSVLSAFLIVLTGLPVFRRSLRVMVTWKLGLISMDKLVNVFNLEKEEYESKPDLNISDARIKIDHLSFAFNNRAIFDDLSINWVGKGLHLVLGSTGAGKSSLVKLILGLYQPTRGSIWIDSQELSTISLKSLRKNVAVVSDEFPLLGRTVFEAISYSRKESKRRIAEKYLNTLQSSLSPSVRLKLDDPIGVNGKNLSKGQVRLLLLLRAFLTRKPILLLDEPFTALDKRLKKHLMQFIISLKKEKTIILLTKASELKIKYDSSINLDDEKNQLKVISEKNVA